MRTDFEREDKMLSLMNENPGEPFDVLSYLSGKMKMLDPDTIIGYLKRNKYIRHADKHNHFYLITEEGIKSVEHGGINKYNEYVEKENQKVRMKEIQENTKLDYDTKLAGLKLKWFYPLMIITILGGIAGIVSLIITLFSQD